MQKLNSLIPGVKEEREISKLKREVEEYAKELKELNAIGIALMVEKNTDKLLQFILKKCRELTKADAGSLYLVENGDSSRKRLRFKISQNDSKPLSFEEFLMDISKKSIAGYVALTGTTLNIPDVYFLPEDSPFTFNKSFDMMSGYRTKSMLVAPMKNHKDEIIGVVQLINRKKDGALILPSARVVEEVVMPFDNRFEEVVLSLTAQAAVSIENSSLYKDIENLFEGFIQASVTAIESRDPVTRGHTERVVTLTVAVAEALNQIDEWPYKDVRFTEEQLKEIRYAGWLHDFGKIGVREYVLQKANKIEEPGIEVIRSRFGFIKKSIEAGYLREKMESLSAGKTEELSYLDVKLKEELKEIDAQWEFISETSNPVSLKEGDDVRILEIAQKTYQDVDGTTKNYLTPQEVVNLLVSRGSLNQQERQEIESHVTHSYKFLCQIPWTKELKNIPEIAYGHHEFLNGEGYPRHLREDQIPIPSKIMTICDIFDALTASDRPYKKAIPTPKALEILRMEAEKGHIDAELLKIFIERKIYQLVNPVKKPRP